METDGNKNAIVTRRRKKNFGSAIQDLVVDVISNVRMRDASGVPGTSLPSFNFKDQGSGDPAAYTALSRAKGGRAGGF
jgi:hypothetical protein